MVALRRRFVYNKIMSQYKYYLRKPKSEIVKDILAWLAIGGVVCLAATSPYFVPNLLRNIKKFKTYPKEKLSNTFYRLKKSGCLNFERRGQQIYISLTKEGKKMAGRFQIDCLKINKPEKWDKKWRIVIFDIAQLHTLKRNAFRGKLKELGFRPLQRSVWVHPYQCYDEIALLRDFFGLQKQDIRLITAENIEEDGYLKKTFTL